MTWKTAGELVWEMVARLERKGLGTVDAAPSQVSAGGIGAGQTVEGGSRVIRNRGRAILIFVGHADAGWHQLDPLRGRTSVFSRISAQDGGGECQPVLLIVNCYRDFRDEERPERNDGISEGCQPRTVQFKGKPIAASYAGAIFIQGTPLESSVVQRLGVCLSLAARNPVVLDRSFPSLALGVGNEKPSVASVLSAEVGSPYAVPESIIPDLGQIAKDSSKSSNKDCWHVFQHDDCRSNFANKSDDLRPETASSAFDTSAFSSEAKVLTWESCADGVDWSIDLILGKFGHVWKAWHVWPMFRQDSAGERVDFAKGDGFKTARHFSAKVETAYAGKEGKKAQRHERGPHLRAAACDLHEGQRSGE